MGLGSAGDIPDGCSRSEAGLWDSRGTEACMMQMCWLHLCLVWFDLGPEHPDSHLSEHLPLPLQPVLLDSCYAFDGVCLPQCACPSGARAGLHWLTLWPCARNIPGAQSIPKPQLPQGHAGEAENPAPVQGGKT